MISRVLLFITLVTKIASLNFDWENVQLTEAETQDYPAIRFGGKTSTSTTAECKVIPGDDAWPGDSDWATFNQTLGGVLLKPEPLGSVCYAGPLYNAARCEQIKRAWTDMNLHGNDPTSVMSQWASGSSCVPTNNSNSTCTQGGFPTYVVNATTVRHIQLAVNFARNNNIRLVVKNSGHDFNGKSIGGHSLSVWIHHLKSSTYHERYTTPDYTGRAVALSAGFQAYEGRSLMTKYNMTFIVAGGSTVGLSGGFFQGGGHSSYTSYYGLGADQVVRINAVTADGRLLTADAEENPDLYWAFRGGGPGTFGIVTSTVVKAYPNTPLSSGSITFSTAPLPNSPTGSLPLETFWAGVRAYWAYCTAICDAGGLGYNFIRHTAGSSDNATSALTFTTSVSLPNRSAAEYRRFIRPLLQTLNELGIRVAVPAVQIFDTQAGAQHEGDEAPSSVAALGDTVGNTLIASRFFQRANAATPEALEEMHLAIREFVEEGGYTFHGINYSPTLEVSGNPDNAVNPAFRETIMHAEGYEADAWFDGMAPEVGFDERVRRHDRLQAYMQKWRDVTPGSGSYSNEGDAQDPTWKDAFFGKNYERLAEIKEERDPEGVFWVIGGVGSDEWEIRDGIGGGREGLVTQDGRLCRV